MYLLFLIDIYHEAQKGGRIHWCQGIDLMPPEKVSVLAWLLYFPGWIGLVAVLGVFHLGKGFPYHLDWASRVRLPRLVGWGFLWMDIR